MNREKTIKFNLSFLNKGISKNVAVSYKNEFISYGDLRNRIFETSLRLNNVNGRVVIVDFEDPIEQIICFLSVIEAGGKVLISKTKELLDNFSQLEKLSDEKLFLFTDNTKISSLKKETFFTELLIDTEKNSRSSRSNKGGIILSSKEEAYSLSLEIIESHVEEAAKSFKLCNSKNVFAYKNNIKVDILELVLPALNSNSTLNIVDKTVQEFSKSDDLGILKLDKEKLKEELSLLQPLKYNFSTIILSSNSRITKSNIYQLQNIFNVKEIIITYQLNNLMLSVIQSNILEKEKNNEVESIKYTKPFGKCNVQILDNKKRISPIKVPGTLWFESKCIANPVGANNKVEVFKIGKTNRIIRALNCKASFESKNEIVLLNDSKRVINVNAEQITPDITEEYLNNHPEVKTAALIYKSSENELVAFLVFKENKNSNASFLRKWLKTRVNLRNLPSKMIVLSELPENSFGEIDYEALEKVKVDFSRKVKLSSQEQKLIEIWEELLEVNGIELEDNFFELGGHSLLASRLVSMIRKEMDIEIPISTIFLYPKIVLLSNELTSGLKKELLPPIISQTKSERIPLSFSQQRLWFLDELQGTQDYHISGGIKLKGKINFALIETALKAIVARHEVLRTVVNEIDGVGYQKLIDATNWTLAKKKVKEKISNQELVNSYTEETFDLTKDYMFKACLNDLGEDTYLLVCVFHHIASDGWSIQVFIDEFVKIYTALEASKETNLVQLPVQYSDYAIWQKKNIQGKLLDEQLSYWKDKLRNVTPASLVIDSERSKIRETKGASLEVFINKELVDKLRTLSVSYDCSLYMVLLSAFKILLYKYSRQEDVCVGTPISGRTHQDLEGLIGFFVNTLAMRSHVSTEIRFEEFLEQVRNTALEAYKNQDAPFEEVVKVTNIDRDLTRNPLLQVMFSLENSVQLQKLIVGDSQIELIKPTEIHMQSDLHFLLEEDVKTGITLEIQYKEALFDSVTINKIATHYEQLLATILENPTQRIGELKMMSNEEENELLNNANGTILHYEKNKSIIDVFAEQVNKTPKKVALLFGDTTMNYETLDKESNKVASYLQLQGIKEGTNIGILFNRGFDMIVSMLGVLKSGCAYIPLDPLLPINRISFIIKDAKICRVIYKEESLKSSLLIDEEMFLSIDELKTSESSAPKLVRNINSTAYVMYTSGTTGKPKGVLITDENILTLINDRSIKIQSNDKVLQWSNYAFDGCTYEIFGSLLCGASLCLIKNNSASNISDLSEVIKKEQLTVMFLTTALFNSFVDYDVAILKNLRTLLFGGEKVSLKHTQKAFEALGSGVLIHVYGPTETTTYATYHPIDTILEKAHTIPIGKPLSNTQTFILNENQNLVPIGVVGELYIGGTGVSKGYLNRKNLTEERFIINPFNKEESLYRTGDLVRCLEDGNIEFIGRTDSQVKIRGYRIELSEIENVLFDYEAISNSCVLVKEDAKGNKRLIGYVVPKNNFNKENAQKYLDEILPDYMVPSIWVVLKSIPLTSNGKIDKRALPAPDMSDISNSIYIAPKTKEEIKLAGIWKQLLHLEKVGVNDNFFELGGHSLLATRVVSMVRKEMNVDISVRTIFSCPTINQLSEAINLLSVKYSLPTILPQEKPALIPLSYSQQGMWFLDKFQGTREYHMAGGIKLDGDINFKFIALALKTVIERHEILRTVIKEKNDVAYQEVINLKDWKLSELNVNGEIELNKAIQKFVDLPFNLSKDYMFRACLFKLEAKKYVLECVFHHIANDGWSVPIFMNEFVTTYSALITNKEVVLPSIPLQYADFAIWQRKNVAGEFLKEQLLYWKKKLTGVTPLSLPTDFARPSIQSKKGSKVYLELDEVLKSSLLKICKEEKVTLFMLLLTGFKVLMHKYSGQNDICIGTPIANRTQTDMEGLIGYFVNTLALRSIINGEISFQTFINQIKETTLEAYEYQHAPFDKVVEEVLDERDLSITQVFQVMFDLQNIPKQEKKELNGLNVIPYEFEEETSQFDLILAAKEHDLGISLELEFCTDLFERATAKRMLAHYAELLKVIVKDNKESLNTIKILTADEEHQLLHDFNATKVAYPLELTVVDLFKKQVQKTPNTIALSFAGNSMAYNELDEKSNQVANYLIHQGVKEGDLISICLERSFEMIIGILGILKSGGAYVPIKPDYPELRIQHILEDTDCVWLLTDILSKNTLEKQNIKNVRIIVLDDQKSEYHSSKITVPEKRISPDGLSYVIYTSGSTGKPKGALIEHKGLLNHLLLMIDELSLDATSVIAFTAPFTFDISVWQILTALLVGGKVNIYKEQDLLQADAFIDSLASEEVTILQLVPSYTSSLLENTTSNKLNNLKYFLVTGEAVTKDVLDNWFNIYPNVPVVNAYGPAEASDDVSLHIMKSTPKEGLIPVGKPVANMQIYIVDKSKNLCPIGVTGELWIGGVGVGRGYLNLEELTKEKFVRNTFSGKGRMYKTGDLGRWLPNGVIEFVGRIDDQVKIRGHRIELGEIENTLSSIAQVLGCAVLAKEDKTGNRDLVGYIAAEKQVDTEMLQENLKSKLPEYMVPRLWVALEKMPLTPNGKIDKKALLKIDVLKTISKKHRQAETETQLKLITIWKKLLEIDKIGVQDNFFDLGGHSLKVISLIFQIKKELGAEISIKDVFAKPTIELISELIDETTKVDYKPIPLAKKANYYSVSNAQRRLWVLDCLVDEVSAYNAYNAYKIQGNINIKAFGEAVASIVNRHEILRTTFSEKKGEPVQVIHNNVKKDKIFEVIDYSNTNKTLEDVVNELTLFANTPFNLEKPFLFVSRFYILNENISLFFCSMHHIICDGWSNTILVKEILNNYKAFENGNSTSLPKLKTQYKDYALWQLNQLSSGVYQEHKEYWHKKLGGNIPVLNFPAYKIRPAVQQFGGSAIEYVFSKDILDKLKILGKKEEASLFMTLLSVVNILMYKYTGQTDIILGTGTAGRTHSDLENQIGFYVNTLPLRNQIDPEKSFQETLRVVKENTIEAFEHQDYPFDILVNELDFEREMSRNPIFDVMILLQSFDEDEDDLLINGFKEAKIEQINIENKGTPFDMDFDFMEQKEDLHLTLTYNNAIYSKQQMLSLIEHLELLVLKITENPKNKTGAISIINEKEKSLIKDLNKTEKEFPLDVTFHHYLENFAVETPNKTAIIFEDKRISYKTLNSDVNKLARAIINHQKVKEDDQVAILLDRSDLVMTTVLAVWKLAGAYIPVDKKVPDSRVISMLKIGDVKAIIADKNLVSKELKKEISKICKLIYIQDLLEESVFQKDNNLDIKINPNSLSVTMFTSGSTGLPKGAMNEHIGMMNHALATVDYLEMDKDAVLVQNASLSFDIAVWQLFTALISGGTTAIYGDELVNAPEKLLEKLIEHKATIFQIVPSYLSMLLDLISEDENAYPLSITNLICCGEAANPRAIEKWLSYYPTTTIVNDYGPAEASDGTTWNVFKNVEENSTSIPIGKPIYNMANYIVDDYMNLCPIGIIGEICVAGVGVGRGYINEPIKTKKAFLQDPFVTEKNQRLYKTGDLGKLLPNGMIEFHGRKDYQIKVNGQRIELGEIEAQLLQLSTVKETTVLDRVNTINGRKYLHAFIVFEGKHKNIQEVKNALSKVLPSYMVPAEYQEIKELPLTMSGKIDRKHLHKIAFDNTSVEKIFVAASNDVELVLVASWKSVLKLNDIGITDNFYEAGGDSISAIQVSSYLYKHQYQVEVRDIMRYATIKQLASFVKPLQKIANQKMIVGEVALTPIQTAFFKANKKVPNYYNQSIVLTSRDSVNVTSLKKTLKTLQNWHDALRIKYPTNENEITQIIQDDNLSVGLKVYEAPNARSLKDIEMLAIEVQSSISLEKGPLMQVGVFKTKEIDYIILAIHHLVIDGVSWRILLEDFNTIYDQIQSEDEIELPAKTDSFKIWSEELTNFMQSSSFEDEKLFWNSRVSEAIQTQIPYDFSEHSVSQIANIAVEKIELTKEYISLLEKKVHKAFNTEINDILLTALSESVYKTFSVTETAVMLESHGRTKLNETLNTNRTIGWFTSEYPVYISTTSNKELADLIKETKEHLHKIPNNGIGFGLLRYQDNNEENSHIKTIELPQIAFNYLGNVDDNINEVSYFSIANEELNIDESPENESDFSIEFISVIKNGILEVSLHYNTLHFKESTIQNWLNNYKITLENIIEFCANREHSETTPSDFDYADLSLDDLVELNDIF